MTEISDIARAPSRVGTGWGFAVMLLGILAIMTPFVSGVAVTAMVAVAITGAGLAMTVYAFKAGSFGKGLLRLLFGTRLALRSFTVLLRSLLLRIRLPGIRCLLILTL